MSLPCRANCINQNANQCQLKDERIKASRVEFGKEWDPVQSCLGYQPSRAKETLKGRKR